MSSGYKHFDIEMKFVLKKDAYYHRFLLCFIGAFMLIYRSNILKMAEFAF